MKLLYNKFFLILFLFPILFNSKQLFSFPCDFTGDVDPFNGGKDIGSHLTDGEILKFSDTNFTMSEYINGSNTSGNLNGTFLYRTSIRRDFDIKFRIPNVYLISTGGVLRGGIIATKTLGLASDYYCNISVERQDWGGGPMTNVTTKFHYYKSGPSEATVTGSSNYRWLRLIRVGNTITGYESTDGVNWGSVSSQDMTGIGDTATISLYLNGNAIGGPPYTGGWAEFDNLSGIPPIPLHVYEKLTFHNKFANFTLSDQNSTLNVHTAPYRGWDQFSVIKNSTPSFSPEEFTYDQASLDLITNNSNAIVALSDCCDTVTELLAETSDAVVGLGDYVNTFTQLVVDNSEAVAAIDVTSLTQLVEENSEAIVALDNCCDDVLELTRDNSEAILGLGGLDLSVLTDLAQDNSEAILGLGALDLSTLEDLVDSLADAVLGIQQADNVGEIRKLWQQIYLLWDKVKDFTQRDHQDRQKLKRELNQGTVTFAQGSDEDAAPRRRLHRSFDLRDLDLTDSSDMLSRMLKEEKVTVPEYKFETVSVDQVVTVSKNSDVALVDMDLRIDGRIIIEDSLHLIFNFEKQKNNMIYFSPSSEIKLGADSYLEFNGPGIVFLDELSQINISKFHRNSQLYIDYSVEYESIANRMKRDINSNIFKVKYPILVELEEGEYLRFVNSVI